MRPLAGRPNSPLAKPKQNLLIGGNAPEKLTEQSNATPSIAWNLKIVALLIGKIWLGQLALI